MSLSEAPPPHHEVPYPGGAYPETHPSHLYTLGRLLGLDTAHPRQCRYLELGCGNGSNLWSMAELWPEAEFAGMDLSARQIAHGREVAEAAELTNLSLVHADILDYEPEGDFDYIVAHGVYAWVPGAVQERILALVAKCLRPNGIAYVSYNALPGCVFRKINRDLAHFHAAAIHNPWDRMKQARAIVEFVSESVPESSAMYRGVMAGETERLRSVTDDYLLHDDFAEFNTPLYFHEVVNQAAKHGLSYLGDAAFEDTQYVNVSETVKERLRPAGRLRYEQYLDFITGRAFRKTLLVHAHHDPSGGVVKSVVESTSLRTRLKPASEAPDLRSTSPEKFNAPTGLVLSMTAPVAKAALVLLAARGAGPTPFSVLVDLARAAAGSLAPRSEDAAELADLLMDLYGGGAIELVGPHPAVATRVGARPRAPRVARHLTRLGPGTVNLLHENIRIDEMFNRAVLSLVDGENDLHTIAEILRPAVVAGALRFPADQTTLEAAVQNALAMLCGNGLLHAEEG